jgi:hypothetical protein
VGWGWWGGGGALGRVCARAAKAWGRWGVECDTAAAAAWAWVEEG